MATLTGLIPVTVGTFEAYHGGGGWGGDTIGGGGGGGGWERRAQDHIYGGFRMELRFAQHTLKEVSKSAYHRLGQANIRVFSSQLLTCDPLLER